MIQNKNEYKQNKRKLIYSQAHVNGTDRSLHLRILLRSHKSGTPDKEKKQPVALTFRICINTPSGSSSRECCIIAQVDKGI